MIFSTKDREPWLDSNVRSRMHAYLATICRDVDSESYTSAVLPITFTLSRRSHAPFPRLSSSSRLRRHPQKWIKAVDTRYRAFAWQRGYGAFSVSPSQLDAVLQYIDGQKDHHRTRTFQEEYRELLRKHGVDFEERYVWDRG